MCRTKYSFCRVIVLASFLLNFDHLTGLGAFDDGLFDKKDKAPLFYRDWRLGVRTDSIAQGHQLFVVAHIPGALRQIQNLHQRNEVNLGKG